MTSRSRIARRDVRALALGSLILTVALLVKGVPAWHAWTTSSRAAAELALSQLADAQSAIIARPAVRDSLSARLARYDSLASGLLRADNPGTAAADLGAVVAQAARTAGLQLGSIAVRADTGEGTNTRGRLSRPVARGDARGDVSGLMQFLLLIELGPPLMNVRSLTVTQAEPGAPSNRPENLRLEFVVEGFARSTTRIER